MATDSSCSSPLVKFEDQVAGHDRILKFPTTNLLVIKPAVKSELEFYEQAQQQPEFECWIPKCFGNVHRSTQSELELLGQQSAIESLVANETAAALAPTEQQLAESHRAVDTEGRTLDEHLCLENVLYGFSRPCILDLKVGTRLYDDGATPAKIEKMKKNAQNTTIETLGVRISGMKAYSTIDRSWVVYDKPFGKALTSDTFLDALLAFFFPSSNYAHKYDSHKEPGIRHIQDSDAEYEATGPRKRIGSNKMNWILESLIEDISVIRNYVQEHPELQLISASLLIAFEGDKNTVDVTWKRMLEEDRQESAPRMEGEEDEEDEDDNEDPKLYDVRLIDFAHSSWTANRSSQDEGLIMGFDNILRLLQLCLERQEIEKL